MALKGRQALVMTAWSSSMVEIIEMGPIGLRDASICDRLTRLFTSHLGDRVIVRVDEAPQTIM